MRDRSELEKVLAQPLALFSLIKLSGAPLDRLSEIKRKPIFQKVPYLSLSVSGSILQMRNWVANTLQNHTRDSAGVQGPFSEQWASVPTRSCDYP